MPVQSVIQRAFTSGELSPAAAARADLTKYTSGLRTCRNFLVQKHGGVTKRPGFRFVCAGKYDNRRLKLIPFIFEFADQTYVLEFGDYYVRFIWHGALVLDGNGDPLELATPYAHTEVGNLRWAQSADILVLTHPNHPVQELQRQAHTTWVLAPKVFGPTIVPPLGLVVSFFYSGTYNPTYVVTAQKANGEESLPSDPLAVSGAPQPTPVYVISIHHTYPALGAAQYNVYCDPYGNGIYGFLGSYVASYPGFNDVGMLPDFTLAPPTGKVVFDAPGNYPAVCTYFQQRLWFARTINEPEKIWGSRIGVYANFSTSTPLQDDDALEFVLAQKTLSPIVDLIPMKQLIALSDTGEWRIRGDQDGAITPTAINADPESYSGGSDFCRPLVIGNTVLYVQARGTIIREMKFDFTAQGFVTRDLTLFSNHLFGASSLGDIGKLFTIDDLTFQQQPNAVVWAVRSDGVLLGLTYVPEQEVEGWHRHDTDGLFENCLAVPNTSIGEDELYVTVIRTIQGTELRYIEKLDRMQVEEEDDWFFVDSGLTYEGAPVSSVSGLDHLEGKVVAVLGDGTVVFDGNPDDPRAAQFTVTGGALANLGASYNKVTAGLPIQFAEVQFLTLDAQGVALRGKRTKVQAVSVLVDQSSPAFLAGPDLDHLIKKRLEPWELATFTKTGLLELNLTAHFDDQASGWVRHTDPTPFTLLAAIPLVELGG